MRRSRDLAQGFLLYEHLRRGDASQDSREDVQFEGFRGGHAVRERRRGLQYGAQRVTRRGGQERRQVGQRPLAEIRRRLPLREVEDQRQHQRLQLGRSKLREQRG